MSKSSPSAFITRTFTDAERREAACRTDTASYYAARFAVKEAVFKALAHLTPQRSFDLRIIETLTYNDGCPYIAVNDKLREILRRADTDCLHISITTENHCATAIVIAEKKS